MSTLLALLSPGHAGTLDVPSNYLTIADALNAATDGDEIVLAPGVYCEALVVNKSVTIRGSNNQGATLDGACTPKRRGGA